MDRSILFTENYRQPSRSSGRFRNLVIRLFSGTVLKAFSNALKHAPSERIVTSQILKSSVPVLRDEAFVDYVSLYSRGLASGDAVQILKFSETLVKIAEEAIPQRAFRHGVSIPKTLEVRAILVEVIELLLRQVEGISQAIDDAGLPAVRILTRSSLAERYAAWVAQDKNLPVTRSLSIGSMVLGVFARIRAWRTLHPGKLPSARNWADLYRASEGETSTANNGVLCFAVEERRIRRMAKITEELRKAGIASVIGSVAHKKETINAMAELVQGADRTAFLNHFLAPREAARIAREAQRDAIDAWSAIAAKSGSRLGHRHRGVPIFEALAPLLRRNWVSFWIESALFIESSHNYLRSEPPRLVLLSDMSLHAAVILDLCRQLNIPTASYLYNPLVFTPQYWIPLMDQTFKADYLLTATEYMRGRYQELSSHPPANTFVVGDVFAQATDSADAIKARKKFFEPLGIASDTRVIVLLSTYLTQDITLEKKRRLFDLVFSAGAGLPKTQIVVKAHPNETIEDLRLQMSDWSHAAPILHDCSLSELLAGTDLACMTFSQSGIEALMSGVPLVIIQDRQSMKGYEDLMPFAREGAASYVPDDGDATQAFRQLLLDPDFRRTRIAAGYRFVEKYGSALDGKSAARTATALREILERGQNRSGPNIR